MADSTDARGTAPTTPIARAAQGRWLGGVCAGLAASRDRRPFGRPLTDLAPARAGDDASGVPGAGWLRLGFVALALVGGIGVVLYLACWLILPGPPGRDGAAAGPRAIVVLAKAAAAGIGLVALAALATVATVFGFGWWVFGAAAIVLVAALGVRRLGPGWALLPVLALTAPAVAVAAGGIRLLPKDGQTVIAIHSTAGLTGRTYRSGLDTLLLDLRQTPLPTRGTVTLHIQAGVRRTIVALPADRCVHVVVDQHITPFAVRAATLLTGRADDDYASMLAFGRLYAGRTTTTESITGGGHGPTLRIDFSSMGGSLYVRDYPDHVDPDLNPYWPGFPVAPESRPDTHGLTRRGARHELFAWRVRRQRELAAQARYNQLAPGPCGR